MHTVCETRPFQNSATDAGMPSDEIDELIFFLSRNPTAGDIIVGTGGCRKVRFARKGNNRGKSGGYRTITFFGGENAPVFLLTVFAKGDRSTLSQRECNMLKVMTATLIDEYSKRVESLEKSLEQKSIR